MDVIRRAFGYNIIDVLKKRFNIDNVKKIVEKTKKIVEKTSSIRTINNM